MKEIMLALCAVALSCSEKASPSPPKCSPESSSLESELRAPRGWIRAPRSPAATACSLVPAGASADSAIAPGTLLALTEAADYSSGGLDAVATDPERTLCANRLVTGGDSILRRVGGRAVILDRSKNSNLLFVGGDLNPGDQLPLGTCGVHDIEPLDDDRLLLTCYDRPVMKIVRLSDGSVQDGPDLSVFADSDCIPEMDQIARLGDRLYVSLELLDRNAQYAPTGPGSIVAIDATTLEVIDLDPTLDGVQAYSVCTNPYDDLEVAPDGRLIVPCLGTLDPPAGAEIVALDPSTGDVEVLATQDTLGGQPSGTSSTMRLDSAGRAFVVVATPDAMNPSEMRLVRLDAGGVTLLRTSSGFSLSALAVGPDDNVYLSDRSETSAAGIWIVPASGAAAEGPVRTSLPPADLAIF